MDDTSPLSDLFSDYTTDAAAADKAMAERRDGVRNVTVSKLDPGVYDFRFLPPRRGQKSIFRTRHTHFIKGGEKTRAVECNRLAAVPGRCLVCEEIERLEATGQPTDRQLAGDIAANFSVQAVALDLAIPFDPMNPTAQIAVLEFKKQVHTGLLTIRNSRAGGEFSHPITGFAISLTKKGAGMASDYTVAVNTLTYPRGLLAPTEADAAAILKGAPDIFAVNAPTDEEVEQILAEAGLGSGPATPPARGGGAGAHLGGNFGGGTRGR